MLLPKTSLYFLCRTYSTVQMPSSLTTVKVPKYVKDYIEKTKKKEFAKELNIKNRRKILYRGDTSKPVISSNIGDYNFYFGQLYNEKHPLPIQSKFWFKAKSSGQKFTVNIVDTNPSLPSSDPQEYVDDVYLPNSFSKMNLSDTLVGTLTSYNYTLPTRIQTLVIPRILSNRHMLIASEPGAGKTMAYLAPIIDQLSSYKKSTELFHDTPLGLIIVPGRELAEQIASEAYNLGMPSNVVVKVVMSEGTPIKHLRMRPDSNVDLLVATLGTLKKLFSRNKIHLSNLRYLVLDESDTLLDDSFIEDTKYILQRCILRTNDSDFGTQLILNSSIYPSNVKEIFHEGLEEEDVIKVRSPYLHRIPFHVEQRFWRVDNDSAAGELLALVKEDYAKKRPVLIFCNKSPGCDWMLKFLEENGVPSAVFHGGVDASVRSKVFRDFQKGNINVLCCTDLASRGLDTQRVRHVINFDFPNNVSDYLLRVGRVGRAGSNHGRVTNLIFSKSGVHTVVEIETAIKRAQRLSNVDSNIKQKIKELYFTH